MRGARTLPVHKTIRAFTSLCAKKFLSYTSKIYFFYFTHLFLQNSHISLSIIHIYSNKIFIFLTLWTVTVRGERKEKRVRWREEREKKNKKIIYTVTIHLQDHCAYLDIFTKTNVGVFRLKCVKLSTFCILKDYSWAGLVASE